MLPPPTAPRKLQLEIPANLQAVYANAVIVSQTNSEIVLDFIQVLPNDPRARVQARVVMTPANAKLLLRALGANLERYESLHGELKLPPQPASLADQLFGGIRAEGEPDERQDQTDRE